MEEQKETPYVVKETPHVVMVDEATYATPKLYRYLLEEMLRKYLDNRHFGFVNRKHYYFATWLLYQVRNLSQGSGLYEISFNPEASPNIKECKMEELVTDPDNNNSVVIDQTKDDNTKLKRMHQLIVAAGYYAVKHSDSNNLVRDLLRCGGISSDPRINRKYLDNNDLKIPQSLFQQIWDKDKLVIPLVRECFLNQSLGYKKEVSELALAELEKTLELIEKNLSAAGSKLRTASVPVPKGKGDSPLPNEVRISMSVKQLEQNDNGLTSKVLKTTKETKISSTKKVINNLQSQPILPPRLTLPPPPKITSPQSISKPEEPEEDDQQGTTRGIMLWRARLDKPEETSVDKESSLPSKDSGSSPTTSDDESQADNNTNPVTMDGIFDFVDKIEDMAKGDKSGLPPPSPQ